MKQPLLMLILEPLAKFGGRTGLKRALNKKFNKLKIKKDRAEAT